MYDREDKEFVLDMFIACRKIFSYVEGLSYEDFRRDEKTVDAVVRNIEILGEAVKNISKEFRDRYDNINWSVIAKTRDKIIHFYFGLDIDAVWKIVFIDIPKLIQKLDAIIKKEGWEGELD